MRKEEATVSTVGSSLCMIHCCCCAVLPLPLPACLPVCCASAWYHPQGSRARVHPFSIFNFASKFSNENYCQLLLLLYGNIDNSVVCLCSVYIVQFGLYFQNIIGKINSCSYHYIAIIAVAILLEAGVQL